MKRLIVFGVFLTFATFCLVAQNSSDYFKIAYSPESSMPQWQQDMYGDNPYVYNVIDSYIEYYEQNEFVKNIHTQNYKHWVKRVSDFIDKDGTIIPPDSKKIDAFWKKKTNQQKNRSSNNWTALGPMQTNQFNSTSTSQANVYNITLTSADPNRLYGCVEGGGIYRTDDKGQNWVPISFNVFTVSSNAVGASQLDADICAVGHATKVLQTKDAGATWTAIYDGVNISAWDIIYNPADDDIIHVIGKEGILYTTDGGVNWTHQMSDDPVYDLKYKTNSSDTIFAIRDDGADFDMLISIDHGENWTISENGFYHASVTEEANSIGAKIAVTDADPSILYVGLIGQAKSGDKGWIGLYKSTDAAQSWTNPNNQNGGPYSASNINPVSNTGDATGFQQGFYNFDIEVSDTDPNHVLVGGVALYETNDSGVTYYKSSKTKHVDIQDLEIRGDDIWVANDGGVDYTNDQGSATVTRTKGINGTNYWGFDHAWNEGLFCGGTYHNGDIYNRKDDNYFTGYNVRFGESPTGYIHPFDNTMYFSDYQYGINSDGITKPTLSMFPAQSYSNANKSNIYFDSHYADVIYLGKGNQLWKSEDRGATFNQLYDFGNSVYKLQSSIIDKSIIYVVIKGSSTFSIMKSNDEGETWTNTASLPNNARVLDISINHHNPKELWVLSQSNDEIYYTKNGGTSWSTIPKGITQGFELREILFVKGENRDVAYVSADFGFFYFDDETSTWHDFSDDLPLNVRYPRIKPYYNESKIRIATTAFGVWERGLIDQAAPLINIMTVKEEVNCSETVLFNSYSITPFEDASYEWKIVEGNAEIESPNSIETKITFFDINTDYDISLSITNNATNEKIVKIFEDIVSVRANCAVLTNLDSIAGNALSFNGTNSIISFPSFELTGLDGMALDFWVKPELNSSVQTIIDIGFPNRLNIDANGQLILESGSIAWNTGLYVKNNKWSHVALSLDGENMDIYVDGFKATKASSVTSYTLSMVNVGSTNEGEFQHSFFTGELDELSIYNTSIVQNFVRESRHLVKEFSQISNNLVGYYQFNSKIGEYKNVMPGPSFVGSAGVVPSTAPVGLGQSILYVPSDNIFTTLLSDITATIETSDRTQDSEFTFNHVENAPINLPTDIEQLVDSSYFIINSHHVVTEDIVKLNFTYNDLDSLDFKSGSAQRFVLFTRPENGHESTEWKMSAVSNQVEWGQNGKIQFEFFNTIDTTEQYLVGTTVKDEDGDGDGVTNIQEFIDDTDLMNPCDHDPSNRTETVTADLSNCRACDDPNDPRTFDEEILSNPFLGSLDCDKDGVANDKEVDPDGNGVAGGANGSGNGPTNPENSCDFNMSDMTLPRTSDDHCNITIETGVWLEGALFSENDGTYLSTMKTNLWMQGLLPGQNNVKTLGKDTPVGQPYDNSPWNHSGSEGDSYNYTTVGDDKAGYSPNTVDWVLVSLRTANDLDSTACSRAALLMKDGSIIFVGDNACDIDMKKSYFLVLEHRNHQIAMSPTPIAISSGNKIVFDFRVNQSYEPGFNDDGQKALDDGKFVLIAGNGDQSNDSGSAVDINSHDNATWALQNNNSDGYFYGDHTLSGDVNAQDNSIWDDNNNTTSGVNKSN